jgi:two-component system sensor histidine kinase KdpD
VEQQRGELRVYLGAAPGVGKTFAMLSEGHRRAERGTDVVVGFVEDHARPQTRAMTAGLEILPRLRREYRGSVFEELDVAAVLQRRPDIVLVDELAHTNVPGSAHAKRWEDVEQLLEAGVDVITTVNVQHLESLNDVVRAITGVEQQETVPDTVVRGAGAIELVDMSPEALRRRIAHGNVYAAEKVDAALSNYFRVGNLTALREVALLWVADRVDDALQRYRAEHEIAEAWPARERVVVALTGGPEGEELIRNAARIAGRAAGGDLLAVYVARGDGVVGGSPAQLVTRLVAQRTLVESLGGTFHTAVGEDVAAAILEFSVGVNATQIVIGLSRRSRLAALFSQGVGERVIAGSGDIDVHVVTHAFSRGGSVGSPRQQIGEPAHTRREPALGLRRRGVGWAVAVALPLLLTLLLSLGLSDTDLSLHLMLFLAATVAVALVGGLRPALASALLGGLCVDYFFTAPRFAFAIRDQRVLVAVAVYIVVAVAVAYVVDQAARRSQQAVRAEREARALSVLTGTLIRGGESLDTLLTQVLETFGMRSAALIERSDRRSGWTTRASVGEQPATCPEDADAEVPITDDLALVASGRVLPAADRRLLEAFARHASAVLEARRLRQDAEDARRTADRTMVRTALLAAVSHDLRTPLAAIKAAVSSLRQPDLDLGPEDTAELLADIEAGTDRLDDVVANLLDMSRLRMGDVRPRRQPVNLEEVVARASLGLISPLLRTDLPEDTPPALADAGLVERVIANLLQNALRHAPGSAVTVTASTLGDRIELRVVDHGPGIPEKQRTLMFAPFTRLGNAGQDSSPGGGVGLGLAVARGFVEAMDGRLTAEQTPGGGLTFVVDLPLAAPTPTPAAGPVPDPVTSPAAEPVPAGA